ncbi:MAG: 2-C-methyl-D-erythritol 4-phosphate cytidylyltransferase [Planctomycetes bacterium]|nr:2-C-methyl-D-erythritol 4-phosphate cytidylyltransferase [Planctomycetota bacterium]
MSHALVVVGAGRGARLGAELPKALLPLGDRAMLLRAAEPFAGVAEIAETVLVVPADRVEEVRSWRDALHRLRVSRVVAGGEGRQDSVLAGVRAISPAADLALVHDAARPFVTVALIRAVIAAAARHGGAIPGAPVYDTLYEIDAAGAVARPVERERLRAAQTPQAFPRARLLAALERAAAEGRRFTDEAGAMLWAGHAVAVVAGDPANVKITTPADYARACPAAAEPEPRP